MNDLEVRIVRLEPQHVAMSYGFGQGPEGIAWEKMIAFVKQAGLAADGQTHRYFGFNNPSPTPGSPNYGYEQWVTIQSGILPGEDIKIKDFPGGLYAVTRCQLANITEAWHALFTWREQSPYRSAGHQWLEECLTPPLDQEIGMDMRFDLYMPIAE